MDEEREQEPGQQVVPGVADLDMQTLAAQLVAAAGDRGIELTGTDGLLTALTRQVLQSALEAEMTAHLGYDKHEVAGRDGGNSRNGSSKKTITSEVGRMTVVTETPPDGAREASAVVVAPQRRFRAPTR